MAYSKAPQFPSEAQKPYISSLNPIPNSMNLYYNLIRIYPNVTEHLAFQWYIVVSGQAFKPEAIPIRDCIIQVLANTTTSCYQHYIGEEDGKPIWATNCTAEETELFSPERPSLFGVFVDLSDSAIFTDLFGGVYTHHNIAYASTRDIDNPYPPFLWPHGLYDYTIDYDLALSNAFPGRHLCAIEHCFPPSEEMTQRFNQCTVTSMNPPKLPTPHFHFVITLVGFVSAAMLIKLATLFPMFTGREKMPKKCEEA